MAILHTITLGNVQLLEVNSNPDGADSAPLGSMAYDSANGTCYQNTDGGTTWAEYSTITDVFWDKTGDVVHPKNSTDEVAIGATATVGNEKLLVLGEANKQAVRIESVAGTIDHSMSAVYLPISPLGVDAGMTFTGIQLGVSPNSLVGNIIGYDVDATLELQPGVSASSVAQRISFGAQQGGGTDITGVYVNQPATLDGQPTVTDAFITLNKEGGATSKYVSIGGAGVLASEIGFDFGPTKLVGTTCELVGATGDLALGAATMPAGTQRLYAKGGSNEAVVKFEMDDTTLTSSLIGATFAMNTTELDVGETFTGIHLTTGTYNSLEGQIIGLAIDAYLGDEPGASSSITGQEITIGSNTSGGIGTTGLSIVQPPTMGGNPSYVDSMIHLLRGGGTLSEFIKISGGTNAHAGVDFDNTKLVGTACTIFGDTGDAAFGATSMSGTETLRVTNGAFLVDDSVGGTPVAGAGTRLMWVPSKRALRAGQVPGTGWDDANLGSYSFAFGYDPYASGSSSIALGYGAYASGAVSMAMGENVRAYADYSFSFGKNGEATLYGQFVQANGAFPGSWANPQQTSTILRGQTTDDTVTELTSDGNAPSWVNRMLLRDDSTYVFKVLIGGRRTDAADESFGMEISVIVDRQAGAATTAFVGTPIKTVIGKDVIAWDADVAIDAVDGALIVQVKGEVGKDINWAAYLYDLEIAN